SGTRRTIPSPGRSNSPSRFHFAVRISTTSSRISPRSSMRYERESPSSRTRRSATTRRWRVTWRTSRILERLPSPGTTPPKPSRAKRSVQPRARDARGCRNARFLDHHHFLAQRRRDLAAEQLDRRHELRVRQRRRVHLEREARDASQRFAVSLDLLRDFVWATNEQRAIGASLCVERGTGCWRPAA